MFMAIMLFIVAGLAEIGEGIWSGSGCGNHARSGMGSQAQLSWLHMESFLLFRNFRPLAECTPHTAGCLLFWQFCGAGWSTKTPDMYDWIGAAICVIGVSVILWAPRS